MLLIHLIVTFLKIIFYLLSILFKQEYIYLLILKAFFSFLISIIIYYLYYFYKKDYKFSRKYSMKTYKMIFNTIIILSLYYSIFILGFLVIRFYNKDKSLNLNVMFENLILIIKQSSYLNLVITIYLFLSLIILLKYLHYIFMQEIQYHKHRLYYFTFLRQEFFDKIFWFIALNIKITDLIHILITQNIAYILYFFDIIRLNKRKDAMKKTSFLFRNELYNNLPRIVLIFTRFFMYKAYVLHYYVLFTVFFYDIFYNQYILENVYKIMPYIFIYELIVRLSKSIVVKNRDYDTFLAYYLYATCFENNEDIITLGDRT